MSRRLLLLVGVLAALAAVGTISIRSSRDSLAVIEACEALDAGDALRTLDLTQDRVGSDRTGRAAAECRCRAWLALGRPDAEERCRATLGRVAGEASGWTPDPELATLAAQGLADAGKAPAAADLLRRARSERPADPRLLALELELRSASGDEAQVIAELAGTLPREGDAAALGRAWLAMRALRRGDAQGALQILGPEAPPAGELALSHWFDTKLTAHAMDDDLAAAQRTRAAWIAAGHDPAVVRARYALALSIAGLADPETPILMLLERSLAETEGLPDAKLREGLAIRLVLTLAQAERLDEALAVYDRHRETLGMEGLSREELVRAARREVWSEAPAEARAGALRFRVDGAPPGAALWLSADVDAPADAPFERLALPEDGALRVARSEGEAPQRWVLRQGDRVLGSGTVSPRAGEERLVRVAARAPSDVAPPHARRRLPADGTRRVMLVLLDCGDWRLVRYLRARGELPVVGALLAEGRRALLRSDPPLTAAALESLVWPGRRGEASLLGLVHQMGVELAGLASVGDNPFAGLRWVLPESDDLFSRVGRGPRSAANLLLSHGGIRAGRHGEVTGPEGRKGRVPIGRAERPLAEGERARFPLLLGASERDALYVRTIAAELDATLELAREGAHDLVAVRIEPLDILTHAHYAEVASDGQDDGRQILYEVYRYIDARLGEVDAALDADDVLVVMSDHGIRTAMEHSENAFFVAAGGGIAPGRVDGRPDLRGVPRTLAELLRIETDWPDTGLADLARSALASREGSPQASATR